MLTPSRATSHLSLSVVAFCATLLTPLESMANLINNGDFETGDYSGWSIDTDGFPGNSSDFMIDPSRSSNYQARIEADYFGTPGDFNSAPLNNVFFANTLYQSVDLSASAKQNLVLSFDWELRGEEAVTDELFKVGLGDGSGNYYGADGSLGFLLDQASYGFGSYTATLDNSFINQTGWTLEFQLALSGYDGFGSFVNIDNVSLEAVDKPRVMPVPAAVWLFASGLMGLIGIRSNRFL